MPKQTTVCGRTPTVLTWWLGWWDADEKATVILSSGLTLVALAVAFRSRPRRPQSGQEVAKPPLMAVPARPADKIPYPPIYSRPYAACPRRRRDAAFERKCNSRGCCPIEPKSTPTTSRRSSLSRRFHVSDNNQGGAGAKLLRPGPSADARI